MARAAHSRDAPEASTALLRRASDDWLARLAARGSARAFAALYERYHQRLYRLCLSIVRSPEDARDALQSTFERAFTALQAQDREIAVRPWLFRIAHNESVSLVRRRRPGDGPLEVDLPSPDTVERTHEQRERLAALVGDLDALPVRQRSVLLMRELSGLSVADIAAAMSMSSSAVKQALFEARSSLHAYAEGREMACEDVRRAISDGDRRALRARTIRAHLRDCDGCSEFRSLIETREADLRVLAPPLPAAAAAAVLSGVLGSGAASHAGAAAGAPALAAAKGGASSLALKGVVGLALTAAIGAGAARLATAPSAHHRTPAHSHYSRTTAPASSSHARALAHQRTATQKAALRARPARPHAVGAPPAASGELLVGGVKGLRGVAAAGVPVRAHGAPAHARATHPSRAHHHAQPPKRRVPAKPTEHPHPKPPSAAERHVHEVTPPSPPVSTVQAPVE